MSNSNVCLSNRSDSDKYVRIKSEHLQYMVVYQVNEALEEMHSHYCQAFAKLEKSIMRDLMPRLRYIKNGNDRLLRRIARRLEKLRPFVQNPHKAKYEQIIKDWERDSYEERKKYREQKEMEREKYRQQKEMKKYRQQKKLEEMESEEDCLEYYERITEEARKYKEELRKRQEENQGDEDMDLDEDRNVDGEWASDGDRDGVEAGTGEDSDEEVNEEAVNEVDTDEEAVNEVDTDEEVDEEAVNEVDSDEEVDEEAVNEVDTDEEVDDEADSDEDTDEEVDDEADNEEGQSVYRPTSFTSSPLRMSMLKVQLSSILRSGLDESTLDFIIHGNHFDIIENKHIQLLYQNEAFRASSSRPGTRSTAQSNEGIQSQSSPNNKTKRKASNTY